jgi:hypothetical protein
MAVRPESEAEVAEMEVIVHAAAPLYRKAEKYKLLV